MMLRHVRHVHARSAVLALALAACADGGNHNTDDETTTPGESTPGADPSAGAPTGTATLKATSDGTTPLSAWQAGDVALGAHAGITVFLTNTGTVTSGPLHLALAGANASQFSIDGTNNTCASAALAAGAQCHVGLVFSPTGATGTRVAQLNVTNTAGPIFELGLHGNAIVMPSGLVADMATLDLGMAELEQASNANVVLSNIGTANIALSPFFTTGDSAFQVVAFDCGASLAPGASCTITMQLAPIHAGTATGTLVVPSSANTVTVQLTGVGVRVVNVSWIGAGHVTAVPNNLTCSGTSCVGRFPGAVVLTAVPDADNTFTGWDFFCGVNPVCTLPKTDANITIQANFVSTVGSRTIHVDMFDSAPGFVYFDEAEGIDFPDPCFASCDRTVTAGTHLTVHGYTPSTFDGWNGLGCVAGSHDCTLAGAIFEDRSLTVDFAPDDRELTTILPRAVVTGLVFAPDGDLIIADALGVSKLGLDGSVVWTTPITGGAHDLATDTAGHIYGASGSGGPGLFALSPAGAITWTRPTLVAITSESGIGSYQSSVAASPDGTVIAVTTATAVAVVNGSGVDRFSVTASASAPAVAPDGTVAFAVRSINFPDQLDVLRYSASGTQLATLSPLPGDESGALCYDATGALGAHVAGFGSEVVSRTTAALGLVFAVTEHTSEGDPMATAVGFDGAGNVVAARGVFADKATSGLHLELFSPTGTSLWTHIKQGDTGLPFGVGDDQVTPAALATDGGRRFAFGGQYGLGNPWIQVYEMPAGM